MPEIKEKIKKSQKKYKIIKCNKNSKNQNKTANKIHLNSPVNSLKTSSKLMTHEMCNSRADLEKK